MCCYSEFSYVFAEEFFTFLLVLRPSQGFSEQRKRAFISEKGIYFRGTGEQSKKDGSDQQTIQSSSTPDQGYHMGK